MFKIIVFLFLFFTSLSAFDVNKASAEDFMEVKGIGVKTAEKIISYRENYGFNSIEDLINVKGIGKKKLQRIKEYCNSENSESADYENSPIDLTKYD